MTRQREKKDRGTQQSIIVLFFSFDALLPFFILRFVIFFRGNASFPCCTPHIFESPFRVREFAHESLSWLHSL